MDRKEEYILRQYQENTFLLYQEKKTPRILNFSQFFFLWKNLLEKHTEGGVRSIQKKSNKVHAQNS